MKDMPIQIDISAPCALWAKAVPEIEDLAQNTIETALRNVPALYGFTLEISLVLTDDAQIRQLNKTYRFKDKPTNVLSFPQIDWTDPPVKGFPVSLGDIILAFETIEREAKEQNKTLTQHVQHLLVHGTLHLCGYDHEDDEEAEAMESLEVKILKTLDVKNPYQAPD